MGLKNRKLLEIIDKKKNESGINRMSMISEQVSRLKYLADDVDFAEFDKDLSSELRNAADTIESLSAKLQAVNMERSAEDCGGWIPCSERLPGITGKYIVCKKDSIFSFIADFVQGQGANYWCGEFMENIKDIDYWMPLPEPYHEP